MSKTLKEDCFDHLREPYQFCVPLLLLGLRELPVKEQALRSLMALHKITSSSQEEMEFLLKSDGILIIMGLLETHNGLANICLKILINTSKKYEVVRKQLLNNNIFHLLAMKVKNETDFSETNLILYSALIVILVQGNYEAQDLMRTSGCLSNTVHILSRILDESKSKPLPCKNAELIIWAIIASSKDPRHPENQAEVGRIIPKVLEYLGKQKLFPDADQLEVIKCLWLLLKYALNQNGINQSVFLTHSGLSLLFRSIQDVVDGGKSEEMGDLLAKITGVLLKLKAHPEFLFEASNYCPVMILCSLLKSDNILVVQQSITFLDSLTREIPQTLQIIKEKEILSGIKKAKIMFLRNQVAAEFFQDLLYRLEISDTILACEDHSCDHKALERTSNNEDINSSDFTSDIGLLKSPFCVVHDANSYKITQNNSNSWSGSFEINEEFESKGKTKNLSIRPSPADVNFHRKALKEEKNFKKVIQHIFDHPPVKRVNDINIRSLLRVRINKIFEKLCSFFTGLPGTD